MEEKDKEKKENIQEKVKLITFNPGRMIAEIKKLQNRVLKLENELRLTKKEPLKRMIQNMLMELFGGHYDSEEDRIDEKQKNKK